MAISLADAFKYLGQKPNFSRDLYETIAAMKAMDERYLPDVFLAVCKEDGMIYVFNRSNEEDPLTGKWKKFEGVGSLGNDYTNEDKAKVGKIGDFSTITIEDVETLVGALNVLNSRDVKAIELNSDKELILKNKDGDEIVKQDMSSLIPELSLEDLKNVVITDVENNQIIYYDVADQKFKNKTDTTLDTAKAYTDEEIAKLSIKTGKISESKPEATDPDLIIGDWYYYQVDDVWYQTCYLKNSSDELVEVTISVGSLDLSDYVSFSLNVASTYEDEPADTSKIPDISWVVGLKTVLLEKIAEKIATVDIVDNLTSTDTDKPLSANQGKVLNDKIEELAVSGGLAFEEEMGTMQTVGGLAKGTIIKDKTDHEVLQSILFPYTKPEVVLSLIPATVLYEKGSTVSSLLLKAIVTKNSKPITSVVFSESGLVLETITDDVVAGGNFNYSYLTPFTEDRVFTATVSDGTETNSSTVSVEFVEPMYYGTVNTGLTKVIQKKGAYTYNNIICNNDQIVFAYPAAYGYLSSIKDANDFESISAFTREVKAIDGAQYVVYTLTIPATLNEFKYSFKF